MRIFSRPLPVSLRIALPLASSALIVLLSSCGSDSSGDGIGAGAQGGSSAGGAGTGGGSGAGQGGSGAAAGAPVGSAGSTSGGAFGAGLAGSSAGGTGNGDAGASEGGGAGDAAAGASGTGDAGAGEAGAGGSGSGGAAGDGAGGTGGGGAGGAGGSGDSIESCFAGLRPLRGISQIPTRENVGEQLRLRLALETADRISTSGTFPWAAVRLGLEIDGILICLDEAALASAYELSLHNCADVLTFESGGQRYEITDPDEPGGEAGMSLTVFSGASPVRGPIPLTTTACLAGGSAITQCRSGGPC